MYEIPCLAGLQFYLNSAHEYYRVASHSEGSMFSMLACVYICAGDRVFTTIMIMILSFSCLNEFPSVLVFRKLTLLAQWANI